MCTALISQRKEDITERTVGESNRIIAETEQSFRAMRTRSLSRLKIEEVVTYRSAKEEVEALIRSLTATITEQREKYFRDLRDSEFSDQPKKRNHRQRYRHRRREEYMRNKMKGIHKVVYMHT